VAKMINSMQKQYQSKGIIYMLEGGYVPKNIEEASRAIIEELFTL